MITINTANKNTYIISSPKPQQEGLLIHGYGSNKEEVLGLALNIAKETNSKILLFDLPGHGNNQKIKLNLENALQSLSEAINNLKKPSFVIGHSLGARLALMSSLPNTVAISMPSKAFFEGSRKELIKTLRVRRVNETKPYAGLEEILAQPIETCKNTLYLKAGQDLESVLPCQQIKNCNHNDIISAPETADVISAWLKEKL